MSLRATFLFAALLACTPDAEPSAPDPGPPPVVDPADIPEGWPKAPCDALMLTHCALPWPSGNFLATADTPTGRRLAFGPESLPVNRAGIPFDPEPFAAMDGYGLGSAVVVDFGPVDLAGLPNEWSSIHTSVDPASPTLLLAWTDDGLTALPHFVEADRTAQDGGTHLFLRPAVILSPSTQHIVVWRDLTRPDGTEVGASEAFRALRDRVPTSDPGIAHRRLGFDAMFDALEDFGVSREDLTLAWHFTTGSERRLHHRLDSAYEAATTADPASLTASEVTTYLPESDGTDAPVKSTLRHRVRGSFTAPSVVSPAEPGSVFDLLLDEAGDVRAEGRFTVPFTLHVPHRALTEPVGVVIYGHGMFGSEWEILAPHLERFAQDQGYILIAIPMTGMSGAEGEVIRDVIGDLNQIRLITDGLIQGLLNHRLLAEAIAEGALEALLADLDEDVQLDASRLHFFGASQGGIYGPTLLATSAELHRGVLAVPGNNYSTMLSRSVNFEPFLAILRLTYPGSLEVALTVNTVQLLWDRTDPISWWHRALREGNHALLLASKGDYQVPVLTNEILSRTFPSQVPLMQPYDVSRDPFGAGTAPYPHTGSGVILSDFGNPWPDDRGNLPPSDGLRDPHSRLAEVDALGPVMRTFLEQGRIDDPCDGLGCVFE